MPDLMVLNELPPWEVALSELPLRGAVAFALRCAKRVEPFGQLQLLFSDAFSLGLEVQNVRGYSGCAAAAAAVADAVGRATVAAQYLNLEGVADAVASAVRASSAAMTLATRTRGVATVREVVGDSVEADWAKLTSLNLGARGELGQPIRWNDPRLGPLWPHGEPKWYTEVVALCRELEEKIRSAPDPNAPPPPPFAKERAEDRSWLAQLERAGTLEKYRGQYVIAANKEILAAGPELVEVHPQAEKRAEEKGVPAERLLLYFVSGLE